MAIVNLDYMQASDKGPLRHMKFSADLKNGNVVVDSGLVTGETELRTAIAPVDVTKDRILLVHSPELMYESYKSLKDFVNLAGKAFRAYHLFVGDIVTLTDDLITGATTIGQYVIPVNATVTLAAAATLAGGTKVAFKVIEKKTLGFDHANATVLEVVVA